MRQTVFDLVTGDAELTSMIGRNSWFQGGSITEVPERPFVVIRLSGVFPGIGSTNKVRVEFRVHDERGSFTIIDNVVRRIREVLGEAEQIRGEQGWLICATWLSDSPDLFDDGFRTNMRSTAYDLTGQGM